jgi:hypothetical protein
MVSPNDRSNPKETIMTSKEKIARRKLSLLELAQELSNVSRACKVMGYSRQQFYEIPPQHPAGRSRGTLLRHAGRTCHGCVTQTKQPPRNPGRFNLLKIPDRTRMEGRIGRRHAGEFHVPAIHGWSGILVARGDAIPFFLSDAILIIELCADGSSRRRSSDA